MNAKTLAVLMGGAILVAQVSGPASAAGSGMAWGVDFNNMTYSDTPCEKLPAPMHNGRYTYDGRVTQEGTDIDATVEQVSGGEVGGAKLAVVVFQCAPPKGCYNEARAYVIRDSRPLQVDGRLASLYDGCPDPASWFHVRFTPKFLYADVRDQGDIWIVSTYRFLGNRLVKVYAKRHKSGTP